MQSKRIKKVIICIAFGFILSHSAFAQDTSVVNTTTQKDTIIPKRYSVAISGGYSYLMGNLTKIDYANPKSGYASLDGYNFAGEGVCWLNKHIGLGGLFSFSSNYVSNAGLVDLAVGYQQSLNGDSATASSITKYNFYNLFVGPYFSFPLKNKKFSIDAKVIGGLTYMNTPDFDIVVVVAGVPHPFAQNISRGISYGFQGGGGIKYRFGTYVDIKLFIDYYYTNPNIKINNSNMPTMVNRQLSNYHQPITMVNFNFGIVYKFVKKNKAVTTY